MATQSPSPRIDINESAIRSLLTDTQGPVGRHILKMGYQVEARAKRLCPVDSGRLRASISTNIGTDQGVPSVSVSAGVAYAQFVHEGTGIYGPNRTRITPKKGRFLVWKDKNNNLVFAKSTSGIPGRPFLKQAFDDVLRAG